MAAKTFRSVPTFGNALRLADMAGQAPHSQHLGSSHMLTAGCSTVAV